MGKGRQVTFLFVNSKIMFQQFGEIIDEGAFSFSSTKSCSRIMITLKVVFSNVTQTYF